METVTRAGCLALASALLLQACSGVGIREQGFDEQSSYQQRAARISAIDHWGFTGRLSMDDGEHGGSGSLRWNTEALYTDLGFRGALGRGAWRLHIEPGRASLEEADGSVQSAPNVEILLHGRVGWVIPVDALTWWVRGLQAPGAADVVELDGQGRLAKLQQFGWEIEFSRYRSAGVETLPAKLEARRGDRRVKLAVGQWRLGPREGA